MKQNNNRLFLICPECHLESKIRECYKGNNFFLTALATVFDFEECEYSEEVNLLVSGENIESVYIVNDTGCSFIQSTLNPENNYGTEAERTLSMLLDKNIPAIERQENPVEKAKKLACINIYRQAFDLLKAPYIGNKVADHVIQVYGLIYDRAHDNFKEFQIEM